MNTTTAPKPKQTAPTMDEAVSPATTKAPQKPANRRKRSRKPGPARTKKSGRKATKTARVIALLERSSGASLKTIMKATGWQAHSVRGFLSGQLGKRLGLRVKSFEQDGERFYSLGK
jgi:Protein of unknown function (DUF3489)